MREVAVARCAVVVLTVIMLAGCGSGGTGTTSSGGATTGGATKTMSYKEYGFEMTFPTTWSVDETKMEGEVFISGTSIPLSDVTETKLPLSVSVFPSNETQVISLKTFADREMEEHQRSTKNYKLVKRVEIKLGELNAIKVTGIEAPSYPGTKYETEHYFVLAGKRGYQIVAAAYGDDYDKYAKDIDAIVKSFKLIEAK